MVGCTGCTVAENRPFPDCTSSFKVVQFLQRFNILPVFGQFFSSHSKTEGLSKRNYIDYCKLMR